MSIITETGDGAVPAPEPIPNGYTADAQERMARLRAMADQFPDESDPKKALTPAEVRIVRAATPAALEKAAVFAEGGPNVGAPASAAELRDAIAFELAYGGVRDLASLLAHRVDRAILRRKLKAVKSARSMVVMAKTFATLDEGEAVRPQIGEMRRAFRRPSRKKSSTPAEPKKAEPATAEKK
jgi:hypothetical protein